MMKVSILVPVYRVERYIERCANSIFRQSFKSIEYIFVDDCSPDNSIEILEKVLTKFPERMPYVKIVRHMCNLGLAVARNTALENASGDYVLHVDSDDFLEPEAVEILYRAASSKNADVVVFDMKKIFRHNIILCKDAIAENKFEYIRQLLWREVNLGVCGKLFSRELFTNNGISFIEGLNFGEDYVITPRLMYYSKKIVKLDYYFYNYIQYNTSSYINTISDTSIDNVIQAVQVLTDFFISIKDAGQYSPLLIKMKLINKAALLKVGNKRQRERIMELYPELYQCAGCLHWTDRMILRLADHKLWLLLDIYVRLGLMIKKIERFLQ